jgi:hypothetical protein
MNTKKNILFEFSCYSYPFDEDEFGEYTLHTSVSKIQSRFHEIFKTYENFIRVNFHCDIFIPYLQFEELISIEEFGSLTENNTALLDCLKEILKNEKIYLIITKGNDDTSFWNFEMLNIARKFDFIAYGAHSNCSENYVFQEYEYGKFGTGYIDNLNGDTKSLEWFRLDTPDEEIKKEKNFIGISKLLQRS